MAGHCSARGSKCSKIAARWGKSDHSYFAWRPSPPMLFPLISPAGGKPMPDDLRDLNHLQRYLVEEAAEDFQHGQLTRRQALKMIAGVLGSLAAASTFLAACAPAAGGPATAAPAAGGAAAAPATASLPTASPVGTTAASGQLRSRRRLPRQLQLRQALPPRPFRLRQRLPSSPRPRVLPRRPSSPRPRRLPHGRRPLSRRASASARTIRPSPPPMFSSRARA